MVKSNGRHQVFRELPVSRNFRSEHGMINSKICTLNFQKRLTLAPRRVYASLLEQVSEDQFPNIAQQARKVSFVINFQVLSFGDQPGANRRAESMIPEFSLPEVIPGQRSTQVVGYG